MVRMRRGSRWFGVSRGCREYGSSLAEGFGEGVAEPLVVGLQLADALCGDLEAAQQGGVGGALAVGDGRSGDGARSVAQSFDLGAQVGLAVEPGSGDAGLAGDGVEGDGLAGIVDAA